VRLLGGETAGLNDDDRIEVTGAVVPGTAVPDNNYTPDLRVSAVRVVAAPADPYEY
jgi:uncharacterized membrane protein YcgQ (UPF0703/DUF1980 family)